MQMEIEIESIINGPIAPGAGGCLGGNWASWFNPAKEADCETLVSRYTGAQWNLTATDSHHQPRPTTRPSLFIISEI